MCIRDSLQSALNRFCLLEEEKKSLYFVIDTDELLQGSMLERYQAYEIAAKNGIMQLDEIQMCIRDRWWSV